MWQPSGLFIAGVKNSYGGPIQKKEQYFLVVTRDLEASGFEPHPFSKSFSMFMNTLNFSYTNIYKRNKADFHLFKILENMWFYNGLQKLYF